MLESEAYKTYHAYATSEKIPKHKYGKNKVDPESSPKKRTLLFLKMKELVSHQGFLMYLHMTLKMSKFDDDEVNMSEDDDQNDDNADDEDDDDQNDDNDDEGDDDQDEDNEQTESDNNVDDFVHPKLSTFNENERQDKEDKEEEWSDDEAYDEETQGGNVEGEELDEEETNEEEEANELYRDVNINLERRDTKMAMLMFKALKSLKNTHVIIKLPLPEVQQQVLLYPSASFPHAQPTSPPDTAENEDFLNKIDENMKKIIKEQVKVQVKEHVSKILPRIEKSVNEHLKAKVLIRSSNEAKTYYDVAANLSKIELKKILIDKMENNKSIDRLVQQKTLYKALILSRLKDVEMMRMKTKNPPLDQTGGPREEELEKNLSQLVYQSRRLPSQLASLKKGPNLIKRLLKEDLHESFNELMDTPLDFSAFVLNRLKVDTLTLELLAGPTFELMKGSCKSLVELEYFLEEVCKATTDQLDWNNPEGQQANKSQYQGTSSFGCFTVNATRSIIIRRRVEDLQLGIESYQKKLNLTTLNTLMRIDELHKFSNDTLNDVRSALDDTLKKIQMKYLPHTIWKKVDRERAGAMIQTIDRQLMNRRLIGAWKSLLVEDCTEETFGC
ncbi:hypothetical protein Tco_1475337 [Tanacetum coccineum]